MRTVSLIVLFAFTSMCIASCSKSYREVIKGPEELFYQGRFLKAAESLAPLAKKRGKNQLIFLMESGYMLHAAGKHEESNRVLLDAAQLATIIPVSISKQAASLLTSERATNYRGEDFEKVLVHMYLGINFLMLEKYNEARVEFKAVNNELMKIKTEKGEARYKQNIMAKYLTAAAYEIMYGIDGDEEDLEFAYIEYQQILKLNPGLVMVRQDLLRVAKQLNYMDDFTALQSQYKVKDLPPDDSGEVFVIFQAGRCAVKKARGRIVDDKVMKGTVLAMVATGNVAAGVTVGAVMSMLNTAQNPIPKFVRRSNMTDHIRISVNDTVHRTLVLEDVSGTAIRNMKDIYPLLAQKVAASVAVKAITAVAAGVAAKTITDGVSGRRSSLGTLLGVLAGVGTGVALFSQMKPDLRCWHTLPEKLHLARIFLKEGTYQAVFEFVSKDGAILQTKNVQLTVKKGKKVFINERTLI